MVVLVCKLTPTHAEGKERPKNEADHSGLVGGSFNKQGNLPVRLVLGDWKVNRSSQWPIRILKVYIESFTGLSDGHSPEELYTPLLSQGCVHKNGFHDGISVPQGIHSKDGEERGASCCLDPA